MILRQQIHIHPGLTVKSLNIAQGYQLDEILIAGLVPAQENQVIGAGIQPMYLVMPAPGGNIDLAANDGLDACLLCRLPELHCPIHAAVVGNRNSSLSQLLYPLHQLPDPASPVQQAVFRMHMQMHKIRHGFPPFMMMYARNLPAPADV